MNDMLVTNHIDVRPISGFTGAEILGVDIAQPLDAKVVAEIRAALIEWGFVLFRNQSLDHLTQIRFTRQFGEITYAHPHEDAHAEGFPEIYPVVPTRIVRRAGRDFAKAAKRRRTREAGWHFDVSPAINPPWGSILRADVVPPYGGDTQWTNLVKAYDGLSPAIRPLVDELRAVHRYGVGYVPAGVTDSFSDLMRRNPLVSEHPVVRVHPESGRRAIYVNPAFTSHIVGLTPMESDMILDLLFEQIARPEYTARFLWEPGTVAFWDNRMVAHRAPLDVSADVTRVLYRTTLIGDVPRGPDGRLSSSIAGKPFGRNTRPQSTDPVD